jgi:hypothetical protein
MIFMVLVYIAGDQSLLETSELSSSRRNLFGADADILESKLGFYMFPLTLKIVLVQVKA